MSGYPFPVTFMMMQSEVSPGNCLLQASTVRIRIYVVDQPRALLVSHAQCLVLRATLLDLTFFANKQISPTSV